MPPGHIKLHINDFFIIHLVKYICLYSYFITNIGKNQGAILGFWRKNFLLPLFSPGETLLPKNRLLRSFPRYF